MVRRNVKIDKCKLGDKCLIVLTKNRNEMGNLEIIDERVLLNKNFRIYGTFESPIFLAKDVAEWIEYDLSSVNKLVSLVDDSEKVRNNIPTPGGSQETWFLTEDGLYEVLMQSRKPIAKQFKKEVKNILKTIRKHGAYMSDNVLEQAISNPDFMIGLLQNLKEEQKKRIEAEAKIELDKPKVLFSEAVTTSKTSILIGDLAKIIKQNGVEMGQDRMFSWLRDNGYLIKRKGSDFNMPTQKSMEMKLFEIKETAITHSDGHITINKTPKVTGAGQVFFVNKLLSRN